MASYIAFLLSGGLVIASLVAVILLHGGWEAGAAGVGMIAGAVFLASFIALGAARDRLTSRRRGAPAQ